MGGSQSIRNGRGHRADRRATDRLKRRAKALGLVCVHCGEGFDWSLHYNDRMAFTADHPIAVANGGSLHQQKQPMHRGCNARKGDSADTEIWEAS